MDVARTQTPFGRLAQAAARVAMATVVAGVLATVAWGAVRGKTKAVPVVERKTVFTDRVRRGELVRQVPVQGTFVPDHVTWLSATSAGQVARIAVRPGAEVEPDTVVLVLANADLELAALDAEQKAATAESALIQLDVRSEADLRTSTTSVATLRGELAHADGHAAAADRLAAQGLMGAIEHDEALSKAKVLSAQVAGQEAHARALDAGRGRELAALRAEIGRLRDIAAFARRRLSALEIRAGVKGVVQDIPLENGQWVPVGTLLGKISEPGRLKADVRVSEAEAGEVHRGLAVRFEGTGGAITHGHVERVDPVVARGSVRLEVAIDDALPPGARADQTVSGWVEIEKLHDVLFIARPAGATERSVAQVFRVERNGRATRVDVRLGRGSAREIEIMSGLVEGDEGIVSDVAVPAGTTQIQLD